MNPVTQRNLSGHQHAVIFDVLYGFIPITDWEAKINSTDVIAEGNHVQALPLLWQAKLVRAEHFVLEPSVAACLKALAEPMEIAAPVDSDEAFHIF